MSGSSTRDGATAVDARTTADLVEAAAAGDAGAWHELVSRYAGLVVAVCRSFRLTDADVLDVSQNVWLQLVELGRLREPAALPGWLVSTTRHECLRTRRSASRAVPVDQWADLPDSAEPLDADVLAAERRSALRQALAALPPSARQLVALLVADPPVPYVEISQRLGIPVGSIGPTRARILTKLRSDPALEALLQEPDDETDRAGARARGGRRT